MKANVGMVDTPMTKKISEHSKFCMAQTLQSWELSHRNLATGRYCRVNNSNQRYPHVAMPEDVFGTFSLERIFSECSKVEHLEMTSSSNI